MCAVTEEQALRADARANHDRLLEAAARAFAADGPGASLRGIARDAEVGIATLYRRFPTRELLVEAVYRNESGRLADAAEQLRETLPPLEAVIAWMRQFLEYLSTKSGMAETLRLLFTTDQGLRLQTRAALVEACAGLLEAAADAGQLRHDLDPLDVLMALGGFAFIAEDQAEPDLRERLIRLLVDGLRV
ncbi:TetR/AcrR family transcriptional regulator [Spongisporangium articulatum]|uniref:TetR/AcrR family transcriptional regulator n=1 Tax=Spongisporangium articulatum TaxID=3362603 RepID=A0ABW8AKM2_9ACTN